jgi:hypothetical protein
MLKQFFGKTFWYTLAGLTAIFVLAIPLLHNPLSTLVLGLLGAATLLLSLWRLEIGLFIAFAELIAFSHGHLISDGSFEMISLRMIIFVAVMVAWFLLFSFRRVQLQYKHELFLPIMFLLGVVCFGLFRSWMLRGGMAGMMNGFLDGNAYFYLLYLLPILSIDWTVVRKRQLLQVLAGSTIFVSLLSLAVFFIYSHYPEWMLGDVYTFLRDTRLAEITPQVGVIYRVFMPSQIFAGVLLLLISSGFWLQKKMTRKEWFALIGINGLLISTILLSLSRSNWVGLLIGGLVFIGLLIAAKKTELKKWGSAFGASGLAVLAAMLILMTTLFLPVFYQSGSAADFASVFGNRTSSIIDEAISSRWKLLDPMFEKIIENPLLGQGFGATVSFETDDPRAVAITGEGLWTTYAMEWGWLEIWLKMGILAPIAFLLIFATAVRYLLPLLKTNRGWLAISLIASLTMLYATHIFSPYLNHPIGLGMILMTIPFITNIKPITEAEQGLVPEAKVVRVRKTATAITSKS